jgi:hypothetical protein
MKTSLDFPDPLFRTLKARAALQGSSLKSLVLTYVERGLRESQAQDVKPVQDTSWQNQLDPFTQSLLGAAAPTDGSPAPTMNDYESHLARRYLDEAKP